MSVRRIALCAAFLALAAGIGVSLCTRTGPTSYAQTLRVATLAPPAPVGWSAQDTPLGATELSAGSAVRVLNFDDFIYRTYRRGALTVRVYAAYWKPGRMDPTLVASHTPDACWVASGGAIVVADNHRVLPAAGNRSLLPAQYRIFEFPRGREEVVFWYTLGGQPVGFADQQQSPFLGRILRLGQVLHLTGYGLAPRDQLLVRISTDRTIEELIRSDLWPALSASLLRSGLGGTSP